MDKRVSDDFDERIVNADDEFLLREGLEVLANYRSIKPDSVRLAVQALIAALAEASVDID